MPIRGGLVQAGLARWVQAHRCDTLPRGLDAKPSIPLVGSMPQPKAHLLDAHLVIAVHRVAQALGGLVQAEFCKIFAEF